MRDVIDTYIKFNKRKIINNSDLYEIYCRIEAAEGRTPLAKPMWREAFESYFYQLWKFIIRVGYVYPKRHHLGTLRVKTRNEFRWKFEFVWEKPRMKITKRWGNIYSFKPVKYDSNYGLSALKAWASEAKKGQSMKGMHVYY